MKRIQHNPEFETPSSSFNTKIDVIWPNPYRSGVIRCLSGQEEQSLHAFRNRLGLKQLNGIS